MPVDIEDAFLIFGSSEAGDLVCLNRPQTAAYLEDWWKTLSFSQKMDCYEVTESWEEETCRFCGCTDSYACPNGCSWANEERTVCNLPACAAKLALEASTPLLLADGKAAA